MKTNDFYLKSFCKFKNVATLILLALLIFSIGCSNEDATSKELGEDFSQVEAAEKRQAVVDNWIPPPCVSINICISDDCGPKWRQGILDAVAAYNALNIEQLKMNLSCDDSGLFHYPTITIRCEEINGAIHPVTGELIETTTYSGLGEWPVGDGTIGETIFLNAYWEDNLCGTSGTIDPCWFQGEVMHEIGHNLGFVHGHTQDWNDHLTGPWDINDDGFLFQATPLLATASHIPGTPQGANDIYSVFNAGFQDCVVPFCEFTPDDIVALQTIYSGPTQECEKECYCECWEEVYQGSVINSKKGGIGSYIKVEMPIECWEDCEGVYGGDPLFNCTKKFREEEIEPEPDPEECYCVCEEEEVGGDPGDYVLVETLIDCDDTRSCDEIMDDDLLTNCVRVER